MTLLRFLGYMGAIVLIALLVAAVGVAGNKARDWFDRQGRNL